MVVSALSTWYLFTPAAMLTDGDAHVGEQQQGPGVVR